MEGQTAHITSGQSSAGNSRLVMLERYFDCSIGVGNSSCSSTADAKTKTLAAARTSTGHVIQVSLRLAVADPLSSSTVCVQVPDGVEVDTSNCKVLATHGDSVLIVVPVREDNHEYYYNNKTDYFVYSAGDPAADPPRPPFLSLLPPLCQHPTAEEEEEESPVPPELSSFTVGLVRRGEDELVVAGLRAGCSVEDVLEMKVAELCLFRSGQWSIRRLPVSSGDTNAGEVWDDRSSMWDTVHTLTVGDRQLCWVDFSRDVLAICDDVFDESPSLRYVQLHMDPYPGTLSTYSVCTTAGGSALKFVNIYPRCCCGGAGATNCERSRHAYTVHTWMLRMDGDLEWVKDGMVDATELWALDAHKDLPRIPIECPVVSMYEPNIIYFRLCERYHVKNCSDHTVWLLKVDMRSKTLQAFNEDELPYTLHMLVPGNVSHFFDSYPNNASGDGALTEQKQMGTEKPPVFNADEQPVSKDYANNPMLQLSSLTKSSDQASEIFEALLQISRYGLDGDELKAYRLLIQNNGRRFRSLLRLPESMRKDWLLMEIKASQAY